jgi:hypothetical protein
MASLGITVLFTLLSRRNYPGGEAMRQLHELADLRQGTHFNFVFVENYVFCLADAMFTIANVYIDDLAAQTGASLFTQIHGLPFLGDQNAELAYDWFYTKIMPSNISITHAIVEDQDGLQGAEWHSLGVVQMGSGFAFNLRNVEIYPRWQRMLQFLPSISMRDALYIMERL